MKKSLLCVLAAACTFSVQASDKEKANDRVKEAATVLTEMANAPDTGIPAGVLKKSACIVVIPGLKKGGFIVTAQYGSGYASCRTAKGWSAPLAMKMEGGGVGFQAGASAVDIILVVMNQKGMDKLTGSKFTLGGEASVAAGPVGRDAQAMTDATMNAEILSYSRSKGVFGGISLKGSTLRPDDDTNKSLYGKDVDSKAVLHGDVPAPPKVQEIVAAVKKVS
jgi:lipid-binding SYLF domain-containing protein